MAKKTDKKKATEDDEATAKDKKDKKESAKKEKGKGKTKAKSDTASEESKESKIKKKQASAKEIDKAQSKRLIKPKRGKGKKPRKIVRAVKPVIKPRNIGVEVANPQNSCTDPFCPFHGTLSVRGQIINGVVMNSKIEKTAIVQREIRRYIPKYERFEKRTHRYAVHNPPCLNVQRGDLVKIMECRPISKTKSFVVIEKL